MRKKEHKKNFIKHLTVGGLVAATVATSGYFLLKTKTGTMPVPSYTLLRVIDGDTFETTEKQLIRLASLNAPELSRCGGQEAKEALTKKLTDHPIYLKVLYRDGFYRLISLVFTGEGSINDYMIRKGYATYHKTVGQDTTFLTAAKEARTQAAGIHGPPCTQEKNTKQPTCTIKGNNRSSKIYYLPTCYQYKNTVVELHNGDEWFCTEQEAQKAGYQRAKQCT